LIVRKRYECNAWGQRESIPILRHDDHGSDLPKRDESVGRDYSKTEWIFQLAALPELENDGLDVD
jgi:hypothetical protein